jgi:hypothetical protein
VVPLKLLPPTWPFAHPSSPPGSGGAILQRLAATQRPSRQATLRCRLRRQAHPREPGRDPASGESARGRVHAPCRTPNMITMHALARAHTRTHTRTHTMPQGGCETAAACSGPAAAAAAKRGPSCRRWDDALCAGVAPLSQPPRVRGGLGAELVLTAAAAAAAALAAGGVGRAQGSTGYEVGRGAALAGPLCPGRSLVANFYSVP